MRVFFDSLLDQKVEEEFLKTLIDPSLDEISLSWPFFLGTLEIKLPLEGFPRWNDASQISLLLEKALTGEFDKESLIRLYDLVFVECLTQVKALTEIDPAVFIQKIQEKKIDSLFTKALERYEKLFRDHPYYGIHDLTLYLAWERVCVYFASLFDDPHLNNQGLNVLRECLIESFLHIIKQGKAVPGFFRLIEALYAYSLRAENLQTHTELEWIALSQGSCSLKSREDFLDVPYIDACLVHEESNQKEEIVKIVTLDSPDRVKAALTLSLVMIEKLKREELGWSYTLKPVHMVCLKQKEGVFVVDRE